jgi:signal transduction histidine kinase
VIRSPFRTATPAGPWPALARTWSAGWPALGQLVLDLLLAVPYLLLALFAVIGVVLLPAFLTGLPFLAVTLTLAYGLAGFERARVGALIGVPIAAPGRGAASGSRLRRLLLDPRPWKAMAHLTLIGAWGCLAGFSILVGLCVVLAAITVPLYAAALPPSGLNLPLGGPVEGFWWLLLVFVVGVAGLAVVPLLARGLVLVDVVLARWLLGPGSNEQVERLSERVETLTQTREATVDSVEAERRRIERDLHDGPQQRLVAIAMDLGMAQERIDRDPAGARELLDQAHAASKEAITEMRMVARGIHPPVLTDRGLDAALTSLAARSPVPVTLDVRVPERPSPTIEAIAYFCVSEALTNVAKHARASAVQVDATSTGPGDDVPAGTGRRRLVVRVTDDGVGGADPHLGTGLHGLTDRVRAVDGRLDVESPPGGPTTLTVTLPWSQS